jgi:hypothetical protein
MYSKARTALAAVPLTLGRSSQIDWLLLDKRFHPGAENVANAQSPPQLSEVMGMEKPVADVTYSCAQNSPCAQINLGIRLCC